MVIGVLKKSNKIDLFDAPVAAYKSFIQNVLRKCLCSAHRRIRAECLVPPILIRQGIKNVGIPIPADGVQVTIGHRLKYFVKKITNIPSSRLTTQNGLYKFSHSSVPKKR